MAKQYSYFYNLGLEKFKNQCYLEAADAFKKSLALKEDWRSYQALGLSYNEIVEYDSAVDALEKSLALRKDWLSYRGLGFSLFAMNKLEPAIDAFKQSLALKKNWQTYQGLGKCYAQMNQLQLAADSFQESLDLNEEFFTYVGLAEVMIRSDKGQLAISTLRKGISSLLREEAKSLKQESKKYDESGNQYLTLAEKFEYIGAFKHAQRSQRIYYRYKALETQKIDTFLGEKSGISMTRDLIESISNSLSGFNYSFCPSYCLEERKDNDLEPWKHLIHIHIPKCAGTNFGTPLAELPKHLKEYSNQGTRNYLWHGNMGSRFRHDAYLSEAFRDNLVCDKFQGSFFANHWGKQSIYDKKLRENGIHSKKICLLRDPSKRLYSHIMHDATYATSKDMLLNKTSQNLSNIIDRYIYDYDLFEGEREHPYCKPTDYENCDAIDFFDISDTKALSIVKTLFLSSTLMPNLVQYNRLNDKTNRKSSNNILTEKDCQEVHSELISRGFLSRDNQIDQKFLTSKTKEKLVLPEIIKNGECIHPITFIYPMSGTPKVMLTKDFISDPISSIDIHQ